MFLWRHALVLDLLGHGCACFVDVSFTPRTIEDLQDMTGVRLLAWVVPTPLAKRGLDAFHRPVFQFVAPVHENQHALILGQL